MKKIYLSLAILAGIGLAGCNDSFLEHAPVTSLTENNAFRSYDNFKSFAWPCYEIFKDNNIANTINGTGQGSCYAGVISYAVTWHLLCHGLCHVVVVEHIFHLASAKHAIGGAWLARHEAECQY